MGLLGREGCQGTNEEPSGPSKEERVNANGAFGCFSQKIRKACRQSLLLVNLSAKEIMPHKTNTIKHFSR